MDQPEEETRRAVRLLESLTEMKGITRGELDELLGAGRSYSSQLFTHRISPRYERILQILNVLEVEPSFFFRILFPEAQDRPGQPPLIERFLARLHPSSMNASATPAAAPVAAPSPVLTEADLDRRIHAAIDAVLLHRTTPALKRVRSLKSKQLGRAGG